MRAAISVCAAAMAFLCPAPGICQEPSAGRKEVGQHVDYVLNDTESVQDLARAADAIVRGVVTRSLVRGIAQTEGEPIPAAAAGGIGKVPDVYTELTVRVDAVLKGEIAAGREVTVLQRVGEMEWRGYRVRVEAGTFHALTEGVEYVLLLHRNLGLDAFVICPDDVFDLSAGRAQTPARTKAARALIGLSPEELLRGLGAALK